MTTTHLMILGAVLAGLSGGCVFVFSNFVMPALDRLPAPDAIRAMQAINEDAINPLFLLIFMGTGAAALLLAAYQGLWAGAEFDPWFAAATALYVLGVVLVTVGGNVPLNEELARVTDAQMSPEVWRAYARPWVRWNTLRAVAAALASGAFAMAAAAGA
jgi:uncharacterized membrane protein